MMLNELELKEKLLAFARMDFIPEENADVSLLLPDMLQYIGTTDSVLRDDLIYCLCQLDSGISADQPGDSA